MMRLSSICAATLSIAACQTTVNVGEVTDTSVKETESSSGTTAGSGDPSGDPGTSNPNTTDGGTTDPHTTGSGTTNSGTTDGSTTNPETSGDTTNPGTTDSSTSNASTTGGVNMGCDEGWTRARDVTITNEPAKPLTDLQVMVKVMWDDDMQVNFADLRFVDGMGETLPYWIEDYTAPIEAIVWVRVNAIAAAGDTVIRMCYGNPAAAAATDGEAAFLFFDNFDGDALDPGKWAATSDHSVSQGKLTILNGAVYSQISPATTPNLLTEAKYKLSPGLASEPSLVMSSAQTAFNPLIWAQITGAGAEENDLNIFNSKFPFECCNKPNGDIIGAGLDEGNIYAFANREYTLSAMGSWKKPFFIGLGYITMKNAGSQDIIDMNVDWVLVRRFTSIEPTAVIGEEEVL